MFFDELDAFLDAFRTRYSAHSGEIPPEEEEDIIDELLDLYLLAFYEGSEEAAKELMMDIAPSTDDAKEVINRKVAGEDYEERVRKYIRGEGTGSPVDGIARVAETDSIRIFNESGLNTAKKGGATTKTWNTMEDSKVRDTHVLLEGVSAPIDGYFYTYDDDKAQAPCQFEKASNNVGCRCWLTFSK